MTLMSRSRDIAFLAGVWVFRLATSDFVLNTVLKLLRSKGRVHLMLRKLGCTGRAGEGRSDVELGSGNVDTTGLIRRACLDVGTSNIDRLIVFGFASFHSATPPSLYQY